MRRSRPSPRCPPGPRRLARAPRRLPQPARTPWPRWRHAASGALAEMEWKQSRVERSSVALAHRSRGCR
ncbi:hypothetical protein EHZ25_04520 [Paraburkholderia tropica]|nr:hypothetical protein EHZ25_04520 [Paraburkholderia tropica]